VEETRSTLKFASRAKLVTTKASVNEVMDDTAMIKKLQLDLEEARRDIKRLEKREQAAEEETREAVEEFRKMKHMIYGHGEIPHFQTRLPRPVEPPAAPIDKLQEKQLTPVKENPMTQSETSDTTGTSWEEGSRSHSQNLDYGPLPKQVSPSPMPALASPRPKSNRVRRSSRSHDTPPPEVVILRDPIPSPLQVENQGIVDRSELLKSAQERAEFLGGKLDASEDLVESLSKDMERARKCIHTLVFKNLSLSTRIEKLTRKLRHRDELRVQQYHLLKYSMYIGLVFFLVGNHELYFAAAMFIWLCLEVMT
jgi:hypothetical protein